jgi:aspartate racemase
MKEPIGIIGGLGSLASAHFYDQLIRWCQKRGAVKDSDFPEIILHNLSCDGLYAQGINDGGLLLNELSRSIRLLTVVGCQTIVIVCNTAHIYWDKLQSLTNVPILNMVEAAVNYVDNLSAVGVMGSRSTRESGIYKQAIEDHGLEFVDVTDDQQEKIDFLIQRVMSGTNTPSDRVIMKNIRHDLNQRGADVVILGCTELPLIGDSSCVDPGAVIIEELLSC